MKKIDDKLTPLKHTLIEHPLYREINSIEDIRFFMEQHVFAVWDFMSLVKKLQAELTCTTTPWIPSQNPLAGRLINEIVWGEETDVNKYGVPMSHFEMYLEAMDEAGASTHEIKKFLSELDSGKNILDNIKISELPDYVKNFLHFTFSTIAENKIHVIASVFTFGREDLIPDMFISMVKNLKREGEHLHNLIYYLERHIEVDGDEHGPMALKMIEDLCQGDELKIQEALEGASIALKMRIALWDGIFAQLQTPSLT